MREITFRAKRANQSCNFVYGYYVKHLPYTPAPLVSDVKKYKKELKKDTKHLIAKDSFSDWNMPRQIELIEIDIKTLGQYTGLKDKNGKEIYEGDIVRVLYTDWASKSENDTRTLEQYLIDIAHIGSVVYNSPEFEIKFSDDDFGSFNIGDHGYIEVIGNIYENKELLVIR